MITLGIETSCDETAVCVLETRAVTDKKTGAETIEYRILENMIHSQADLHAQYGGVFPMMAKREHEKNLPILMKQVLGKNAEKVTSGALKIDRIAVTRGPGLEPALRVGIDYANKLGAELNIPVVGVNHMEGHILGSLLKSSAPSPTFAPLLDVHLPAIAILISGGHTELVLVKKIGKYEVIGHTKDDAIGEAFDKVARLLGLPYPGGPKVSELAERARIKTSNSANFPEQTVRLPRPMLHSKDFDFSFSGLKTAVLYEIRKTDENATMKPNPQMKPEKNLERNPAHHGLSEKMKMEIAREFEDAVTEVVVKKTSAAIEHYGAQSLIAGGGVIANKHIREALAQMALENSIPLFLPPTGVSGDNALMIALAGSLQPEKTANTNGNNPIKAAGNLSL